MPSSPHGITRRRSPYAGRHVVTPLIIGIILAAACDVDRSRPTGLEISVPETSVEILVPERDQLVPADSLVLAVVRADGLIQSVDLIVRRGSGRDTLQREREEFAVPAESIELEFPVRIPNLATGSILEFIAEAIDAAGERRSSTPVPVIVIDCETFPLACV